MSQRTISFGQYTTIEGLDPEEGPYPQWNFPVIRWGTGPATKLKFQAAEGDVHELALDCVTPGASDLVIDIKLNGIRVARETMRDAPWPKLLRYDLHPHAGTNELEISYSTWDTQTNRRRLALMFSGLRILRK